MNKPVVSIVMSVYNGEDYLSAAVESVLAQTYKDFEFLIIDDGSSDKSPQLLKKYASQDKRIKLLSQKNQGLVASLNRGIKEAGGTYIARQDADDESTPGRLAAQVNFLESHSNTVIVGSSINVMDDSGFILHQHAVLLNDPELRQELIVRPPFAHGSVIFKKDEAIKAGLYDQDSWPAEDYDFWLRLSEYGQLANIDQYLYTYREHQQGISLKNEALQKDKTEQIQSVAWRQHERLLPKRKINLNAYKNLAMGQLRIERIIDNSVFVSKQAWRHNQKALALKNISRLGNDKIVYKKSAGKLKRRIKKLT